MINEQHNVAFFSNQFASTNGHGIARYAKQLYHELKKLEKKLKIYPVSASAHCTEEELKILKSETGHQILPWGRVQTPLTWKFFNAPVLEKGIKNDIDLVHTLSLSYPVATQKPLVVTVHDIGPLTHPQYFTKKDQWFMKSGIRQVIKQAAAIICVSKATADAVEIYAKSKFRQSVENRIQVIHEGVDNLFFEKPNLKHPNEKKIFDEVSKKPFILTVGKLSPRKNVESVLKAFSDINNQLPEHQIVAVGGEGWNHTSVKTKMHALGLQDRVHFLGYVSNTFLRMLYTHAEVFVYPSLFEGFGLTILEAMASGCPVITSNNSSLPEVAGNAALLVDGTKVLELKEAIIKICTDNQLRQDLKNKGYIRAKQFTWDNNALKTYSVYKNILK